MTDEMLKISAQIGRARVKTLQPKKTLEQTQHQLSLRIRVAEVFLNHPGDEMYGEVLDIVLETMDSHYGLFGYINEVGDLAVPSLTRDIMDECRMPDKDIIFPRKMWGGLWGETLILQKPLLKNEKLVLPQGHVFLSRALSMPILFQGDLIGILAVANKDTDYDEADMAELESIAGQIAPILQVRLERDLEEKARFRAEAALKQSLQDTEEARDKMDGILKSIGQPLVVTDNYMRTVLMNRRAEDLFRVRLSEVVSRPIDFVIQDQGALGLFKAGLDNEGSGDPLELKITPPGSDQPVWIQVRISEVLNSDGGKLGNVSVFEDITEERQIYETKTESMRRDILRFRSELDSIREFWHEELTRRDLDHADCDRILEHSNEKADVFDRLMDGLLELCQPGKGLGETP